MKVSQAYSSQKARYAPTDVFIANGFSFKITGFTLPRLSLRRTVSQMSLFFYLDFLESISNLLLYFKLYANSGLQHGCKPSIGLVSTKCT